MSENNYILTSNGELYHFGVKGMKWGRRKQRISEPVNNKKQQVDQQKIDRRKKALKIGTVAVASGLAVYGAYKINKSVRNKNMAFRIKQGEEAIKKYVSAFGNNSHMAYNKDGMAYQQKLADMYRDLGKKDSFVRAAKNVIGDSLLKNNLPR